MFKYSYLIVALFATDCLANEDEYLQCVQDYLPQAEFDGAALMVKQKCEAIHSDKIMLPREKARLQCQLESASTAKTETALMMLMKTCDERHSFENHKE
jgi:hypothetical protein